MLKKIEKFCREYMMNVAICGVLFAVGGMVKDSVVMKGAASASTVIIAAMSMFLMWRRKGKSDSDLQHEELLKSYNEIHADLIRARCLKLREEVKDRFADMGVIWDKNYHYDIEENSFNEIIELEAMMLYDPEADSKDFKRELEEVGYFESIYPVPEEKYVMLIAKAEYMTEEEKMQRECLKKFNII